MLFRSILQVTYANVGHSIAINVAASSNYGYFKNKDGSKDIVTTKLPIINPAYSIESGESVYELFKFDTPKRAASDQLYVRSSLRYEGLNGSKYQREFILYVE